MCNIAEGPTIVQEFKIPDSQTQGGSESLEKTNPKWSQLIRINRIFSYQKKLRPLPSHSPNTSTLFFQAIRRARPGRRHYLNWRKKSRGLQLVYTQKKASFLNPVIFLLLVFSRFSWITLFFFLFLNGPGNHGSFFVFLLRNQLGYVWGRCYFGCGPFQALGEFEVSQTNLGPPQNRMNSFDSNFSVLSKSKTRHLASKVILVICNTWLFEWSFQSIASTKDTLMLILLKLVIYWYWNHWYYWHIIS